MWCCHCMEIKSNLILWNVGELWITDFLARCQVLVELIKDHFSRCAGPLPANFKQARWEGLAVMKCPAGCHFHLFCPWPSDSPNQPTCFSAKCWHFAFLYVATLLFDAVTMLLMLWKRSCFVLKYMFWSVQYPVVSCLQMFKFSLDLQLLAWWSSHLIN